MEWEVGVWECGSVGGGSVGVWEVGGGRSGSVEWECGSVGGGVWEWECGRWECGSVGVWECGWEVGGEGRDEGRRGEERVGSTLACALASSGERAASIFARIAASCSSVETCVNVGVWEVGRMGVREVGVWE